MRFAVSVIEPAGYKYSHFLYDLCKYICYSIESVGYDCCIQRNRMAADRTNILVGSHNQTDPAVVSQIKQAGPYILLQTEVIRGDSINNWNNQKSFATVYLPLMRQATAVWTGSEENIAALEKLHVEADMLLWGYHPLMEEIHHKKTKDIDFLFSGSISAHRKKLLDQLTAHGCKVVTMFDDAAMYRNDLIARARVNLAPNHGAGLDHLGKSRVLYMVNNRAIVVVEKCFDQARYEHCFPWAETEHWVDLCMETLRRPDLAQVTEEYYDRFKQIRMADFIAPLLENFIRKAESSRRHTSLVAIDSPGASPVNKEIKELIPQFNHAITVKGMTTIIILTHNRLEQTKKCVKSIRRHTPEAHEVIFVDNASTDGTVKWLQGQVKENRNYHLIENKGNVGLAKGRNQGINASQGEFILLLDNDVVVSEGWLSGMLECLNRAPDAGMIGAMSNSNSDLRHTTNADYPSLDHLDTYAAKFKERYHHRRIPRRNISGFCMLFRRTLTEKIGWFDERFDAGHVDEDYSVRTALADYRNYIAGDIFIHHSGGKASPVSRNSLDKKWTLSKTSPEGRKLLILKTTELVDELYQKGLTDRAIAVLINGIKLNPDAKEYYYELMRIFIESKKYSEAWEVVGTMPETARNDLKGLQYAGYAKEGLGLDDEAAVYADKILSLRVNHPAAINLKGILAYKKSDKAEAADYFRKAIDADPGYGEANTNLGVLYWGMDKKDEALQHLQRGFILSPIAPDTGSLYYSVISSSVIFDDAETDFREACQLYPYHKNLTFLYIEILIQQGKLDRAMRKIEDALILFGLNEGILNAALTVREKTGPLQMGKAPKKNTLSLCMIVKNEEQFLVKCLNSVRDIVDEMIVVDTGSTDRTMDIARIFGAKVFEFPWTGDFSAARNYSLAQATGDWILILDADEVISSLDHKRLLKTINRADRRPVAFDIVTRNYIRKSGIAGWVGNDGNYPAEETGIGWNPSHKVRLFRKNSLVRFENPVHELLEAALGKAGIPIEKCPVPIHHYGRLDDNKVLAKGREYYQMGRRKLDERGGGDYVALRELAIQATEIGRFEEAIDLWKQVLALRPENSEALFNMGYNYIQVGKYQEALQVSKRSVDLAPGTNDALLNYALCEMLTGNALRTTALLEEHASGDDQNPTLLALLGSSYLINGDNFRGLAIFGKLAGKKLDLIAYLNSLLERLNVGGRIDYILRLIDAVASGNSGNTQALRAKMTPTLNKIASQLHAQGENAEALLILNAALKNKISDQQTLALLNILQKEQEIAGGTSSRSF